MAVDVQEKHRYQLFLEQKQTLLTHCWGKEGKGEVGVTNTGSSCLNKAIIKELKIYEKISEKSEYQIWK